MGIWNWIKSTPGRVWAWIKWMARKLWKSLALLIILVAVWFGFLKLVGTPPLETTPVLIMLWITASILILALFPSVIDLIKRVKIGDFEIELKDTIASSTPQDYISAFDISGTSLYAEKGDARNLQKIFTGLMQEPGKPILLIVNLDRAISKTLLFVYLFLIELFSTSIVFFVTKDRTINNISDLKQTDVVGIISGQELINAYFWKFPSLLNILNTTRVVDGRTYDLTGLVQIPSGSVIESLYQSCERQIQDDFEKETRGDYDRDRIELLKKREVENWLKDKLNKSLIEKSFGKADLEILRQCLFRGDDYIILTENKKIVSVAKIEILTRSISKNLLTQIAGKK